MSSMTTGTFLLPGACTAFEIHGEAGPWITFSHSLGCSRDMWTSQVREFARTHRVLTYDLRGHGQSAADRAAGSLALLAADVLALLDHLDIETTHFVGLSIGGMIGQALALASPARVASLVLANTTHVMPPAAQPVWDQRIRQARADGVASLAESSLERWLPAPFRHSHPEVVRELAAQFAATGVEGYVSCCEAIRGLDHTAHLPRLECPVLVIAGAEDAAVTPDSSRAMARCIPHARFTMLEGAGHLSAIEQPERFNQELRAFLDAPGQRRPA